MIELIKPASLSGMGINLIVTTYFLYLIYYIGELSTFLNFLQIYQKRIGRFVKGSTFDDESLIQQSARIQHAACGWNISCRSVFRRYGIQTTLSAKSQNHSKIWFLG